MEHKRVLVVEDESTIRKIIKHILGDGYEVFFEETASDAITFALNKRPDVVLLDLTLKGSTGFEVLDAFKQSDELKSIPIIVMTKRSNEANVVTSLEKGAVCIIPKPIIPDILRSRVSKYIGRKVVFSIEKIQEKPLVLICDDTPSEIRTMVNLIGDEFDTIVSTSAESAIELISNKENRKPDIFVIDAILGPGMSGLEFTQYLKDSPNHKSAPVIMNTNALDMVEDEITAINNGADEYLIKSQNCAAIVKAKLKSLIRQSF